MPETETAATSAGSIAQIAAALGYPATVIELVIVAFLIILLLVGVLAALAVFRIRKELISLNFKIFYIGRLIEQALKKAEPPEKPPAPPKIETPRGEPAEPERPGEKWKF